ncbi:hypothetical protein OAB20_01255 [Winogradskyella sp.]|nr:hypothetical protein [Winogradskyella sp.]
MKSIDDLLNYSNLINKLNLESKSIHYIIWFEEEYIEDVFLDINCPQFQSILINAEEKKVKLIFKNFDKAIKSQCGNNNLNLDKHDKDTYWDYSFTRISNVGSLRKRFALNKLIPNNEKVFKELWLRDFIKTITKISKNIKFITEIESEKQIITTQKDYYKYSWFKIGLLFANGEMLNLLKKYNNNATKIAEFLGDTNLRPYISESIYGSNLNSNKNVFSSHDRGVNIINYCKENNIPIENDFMSRFPSK